MQRAELAGIDSEMDSRVGRPRMPGFIETCDPMLVDKPATGERWVHEVKWDGYRGQAHLRDRSVKLFTRSGADWSATFHPVSSAVARLRAEQAILDGEVVSLKSGIADFQELRRQLGEAIPAVSYQVFDLLWLDGEDLRPRPYRERKELLKALIGRPNMHLAYVEHFETSGARMLKSACCLHLEGIVSKDLEAPYRSGRTHVWQKAKCAVSETLAVIGYSTNDRGRIDGLMLGRMEKDHLVYAGHVERGMSLEDLGELSRRLTSMTIGKAPARGVPSRKAKWVRPEVMVEVAYPNKTADGRLRHPSFKGLRDDLITKRDGQ